MWQIFLSLIAVGTYAVQPEFLSEPKSDLGDLGGYNLTYAYHGLYFSAAAYCSKESILAWDCGSPCDFHPGFTAVQVYTYKLYGNNAQVFTGYSESAKKFIVSFQGTSNPVQLITEGVLSSQEDAELAPGHTYKLEKYFWEAYNGLYNIRASIMNDADQFFATDYDFFITGHSLGGALASICAMDLIVSGQIPAERLMIYTLGQPRVGDPAWAAAYDKYVTQSYRIVHANDIVPHVPPEWLVGWDYLHPSQEIWYNEAFDSYTECGKDDDPNCSDSTSILSRNVADHLCYFNYALCDACGKNSTSCS